RVGPRPYSVPRLFPGCSETASLRWRPMPEPASIRIAVIGSGPAGFYAAGHLLKASESCEVDMLERLPTPWGLVRSGVAPDHPKIKSVTRVYEKTAAHPRFRYFGNITFGQHVSREELLEHYHAIVYATGSPSDRPLGIPGEELPGSHAATEFVGWYNGHPDHTDLEVDLLSAERAVVVGNGNVAIDVARMLVLAPSELAPTDTADHALAVLAASHVSEVIVLGRRGPAQAAFTNPELLELGELADADVIVDPDELVPPPDGGLRAQATEERETIHAGLVFRAIGYRGLPLPGVPFDERAGVIPNRGGRVTDVAGGSPLPGEYVVGWIKRGPSGVIGTNKKDAQETVDAMLADLSAAGGESNGSAAAAGARHVPGEPDAAAVEALLRSRQPELVTYAGWEAIDRHERALGEPAGRPRVKLTRIEELLRVAAAE